MTVISRSNRGSSAVGVVLLVVLLALAAGAFLLLRGGDQGGVPARTDTPAAQPAGVAEAERGEAARKMADRSAFEARKAEHGINFTVVCFGPAGASEPIAGVEVRAAPAIASGIDLKNEVTARTDASGIAQFTELPYTIYDVSAAPEGHVPLRLRGAKDGKRIELVFRKGVGLNAVVTNAETGAPVADAYVQIRSDFGLSAITRRIQIALRQGVDPAEIQDHEKLTEPQATFRATATTDAEGRFSAPAIPPDTQITVQIDHGSFDQLEDRFEFTGSAPVTKEYALLPRTQIFGRVVADESGEPIPGAKVQAGQGGIPVAALARFGTVRNEIFEAVTDANGNYRLKRIPRGKQSLYVHYPGYDDYAADFEVRSTEPHEHEIRLVRSATLEGQVVDNANNPIEGVDLYWIPVEAMLLRSALPREPHARTAADGTFQLRGFPVGRPFNVLARHPEYVGAEQDNLTVQPGEVLSGVQIMMSRGGRITGTIVDSSRQPLAGATVVARPVRPEGAPLPPVTSAPDGSFAIDNTHPATFEVTCQARGYVKAVNTLVRDVTTGVQAVMLKEATYAGRFLDAAGQAIPKFRVRLNQSEAFQSGPPRSETIRDKDGKFEINGLAAGLWDFEFSADGVAPLVVRRVALREGERLQNQELRAHVGCSVGGLVKSIAGKPIQGALVRLDFKESFSADDKTYTVLQGSTNSNGEYEVKNLLPGRHLIWVTHPSFAPSGEREIMIEEGRRQQIDFNLPKPASLRLVVRDVEGNTVPSAQAWLFKGDSPLDSTEKLTRGNMVGLKLPMEDPVRTGVGLAGEVTGRGGPKFPVGETGELMFVRKEPGAWTLWVTADGHYKYTAHLTLEAGKESVHEAELKKIQPGTSREDAFKGANVDPNNPPSSRPAPTEKPRRIDTLASLTPEERRVMHLQQNGEELTAEEMKTLRQARRKARDAKKQNDEVGASSPDKGPRGMGKGKGRKPENPEGGGADGGKPKGDG